MSDSLPNSGVAIVVVIRNAVVTQACAVRSCRSLPIVLIAVDTMLESSAARNMPSMSPDRIVRIWRCDSAPSDAGLAGRVAIAVMRWDLLPGPRPVGRVETSQMPLRGTAGEPSLSHRLPFLPFPNVALFTCIRQLFGMHKYFGLPGAPWIGERGTTDRRAERQRGCPRQ